MTIALLTVGAPAIAQTYPVKPIEIVVPYTPGGLTDRYARVIAQRLHDAWGQPVVLNNRAGANGLIGTQGVQRAAADGYTLLFTSSSAHVVGPLAYDTRPFDPVRDFTPITMAVRYPMYLLINPALPAKTVAEFVALAKHNPGKFNCASAGVGSGTHLACELFNVVAGTD